VKFLESNAGKLVLEKLAKAAEVQIAVAFFSPSDEMCAVLLRVPILTIVISEEFVINDPYKLERLTHATLKSIPTDHGNGRLHAKVVIARLPDGSYWVLLGSANFTYQGMFSNQEACVVMESSGSDDTVPIQDIRRWFDALVKTADVPDLAMAKLIFDQRSRYRLEPRKRKVDAAPVAYWALKTTSGGSSAEDHWPRLLSEGVIAIGWEELPMNPAEVNDEELLNGLQVEFNYTKRQADYSAKTIRKFIDLREGTIILLCRGYTSNQRKDVHIYGFARVSGPFRADPFDGSKWRFKHDAVIQEIGMALPKEIIASALDKEALRQTMHQIDEEVINRLSRALGVLVEV
jgi:hypothetical protein